MKIFYNLLVNSVIASITNMTVWFAIIFYVYLETKSVFATAILSGLWLVGTAASGIWFGSIVDHNKKKTVLLISSFISLIAYIIGFVLYIFIPHEIFTNITHPVLWIFSLILMTGILVGNLRGIVIPTLVTLLVPEENRDKANGLTGTAFGISFLVTSVISGFLVGHSGMYLVLILAIVLTIAAILHVWIQNVEEKVIVHGTAQQKRVRRKRRSLKLISKAQLGYSVLFQDFLLLFCSRLSITSLVASLCHLWTRTVFH